MADHPQNIQRLLKIMATLRTPEKGCPWDLEQNFATIAPYTIEEAYEVAEAIDRGDMGSLKDELGDLLFQVVFHSQMASEAGHFTFDDVVKNVCEKMIRRHPHVFADASIKTADAQIENWENIKEQERAKKPDFSVLADVPHALPALMRAQKLGKRAAREGFDWPDLSGAIEKLDEELEEVLGAAADGDDDAAYEEVGDLLFAVVNLARHLNVDAEDALRRANKKFTRRFQHIERALREKKLPMKSQDLDALEALWVEAKLQEKGGL